MKSIFLFIVVAFIATSTSYAKGGSSGVGGGPILGQVGALKMLLDNKDFLFSFSKAGISTIHSIESEGGAVYDGGFFYKVTSDGGCTMRVKFETDPSADPFTAELILTLGTWNCP